MRKTALLLILLLGLCLLCACGGTTAPVTAPVATAEPSATPEPTAAPTPIPYDAVAQQNTAQVTAAESYDDVYRALTAAWTAETAAPAYGGETQAVGEEAGVSGGIQGGSATAGGVAVSDGINIYTLSGNTLRVFRASGNSTRLLTTLEVGVEWTELQQGDDAGSWGGQEKCPVALYLSGTRLAVISDWYGYNAYTERGESVCDYSEYICVDIYDVSVAERPELVAAFGQDGFECAAALSDGSLRVVSQYWAYDDGGIEPADYIPALRDGAEASLLPPEKISLAANADCGAYMLVCVYDLNTATRTDSAALLGADGGAYLDGDGVWLLSGRTATAASQPYTEGVYTVTEYACAACTDVFRYAVRDGALSAPAAVTVAGGQQGDGDITSAGDAVRFTTYTDNYRYALYTDAAQGFDNIRWGERETGTALCCLDGELRPAQDDKLPEGYLYDWTEDSFLAFSRIDGEGFRLTLYRRGADGAASEVCAKDFGPDYASTLDTRCAICVYPEAGIIGIPAEEGYFFFGCPEETDFVYLGQALVTDWRWNVRALLVAKALYVVDAREMIILATADMSVLNTLYL